MENDKFMYAAGDFKILPDKATDTKKDAPDTPDKQDANNDEQEA
jgi:hypothetical protein